MDNLTHTAIGLFLSRAGLNRLTPLAAPILMLAANAPDVDAVSAAGGSLSYLHYHRHLTHALAAIPVMAALPVLIVALAARGKVHWLGAYCVSLAGVLSHVLLDWTNVYGIRLLLPFSDRWLRLDLINIVDLWIWLILGAGLAGPFLGRLVGAEITSGAAKVRHYGRGWARVVLSLVVLYTAGRVVLHRRAVATIDSRIYGGSAPTRLIAVPHFANPLQWRAVAETGGFFAVQEFSLAAEYDPTRSAIYHKPEPDPAIEAARRTTTFQKFLRFSQFPLWRVLPVAEPENGKQVEVMDMRFGTPAAPSFVARAIVDNRLTVVREWFQFGRR
jgi:inner membrane protein